MEGGKKKDNTDMCWTQKTAEKSGRTPVKKELDSITIEGTF